MAYCIRDRLADQLAALIHDLLTQMGTTQNVAYRKSTFCLLLAASSPHLGFSVGGGGGGSFVFFFCLFFCCFFFFLFFFVFFEDYMPAVNRNRK